MKGFAFEVLVSGFRSVKFSIWVAAVLEAGVL